MITLEPVDSRIDAEETWLRSAICFDPSTPVWILHVDDSANQQGCGAGLILTAPDWVKVEYALRFSFRTSNNEVEYEDLLAGLRLAKSMGARSENSHANAHARLASAIEDKVGRQVPVEILTHPSTTTDDVYAVRYEDTWISPIHAYLTNDVLPNDKAQARKLRYRSARYTVINSILYKHSYTMPYLKCITIEEGDYVLQEIHGSVCGDHSGSRSLAQKAFRQGYYWPNMHQDANTLVKKCDKCQRFSNVLYIPAEPLTLIVSLWPLAQWGLDLIGPMPQGKGQVKYVVVAVDYFTKWVEAEALTTITAARMEDFIWTRICCQFGIPYAIITDNSKQFDSKIFRQFCTCLKINLFFASPAHPQSNSQVKAINKITKKLLKRQLDNFKGSWPEKLLNIHRGNPIFSSLRVESHRPCRDQ
ncbi:hypothetical protein L3X38_025140 [Prunus dulcis]|uniref:Integrase catalytic domain-containing protein n=1 Tax=Prunus dulcis TaxID=3755 RepID=A0AAD4W320_PRUDU|nr:hypothetical protein L3X38_025140 [Prunus dulcis]